MNTLSRREFVAVGAAGLMATPLIAAEAKKPGTERPQPVGPFVGHVDDHLAMLWFRPATLGDYTAVLHQNGREVARQSGSAAAEHDGCIQWRFQDLQPATRYTYSIEHQGKAVLAGEEYHFQTAPAADQPAKVCLAFGSCADMASLPLWTQMREHGAEGLVLLGDTPYIDSVKLEVARAKHREFVSIPALAELIRNTPMWGTWDDHDFGVNGVDGRNPAKKFTRQAFAEYRALATCGHEGEGIYTRFRTGPIEVFLLDTRWFSNAGPSPVDPKKPTLLGEPQWKWLLAGLKASTAPFKILACGMIWDDKVHDTDDDWGSYLHERSALFDFIGQHKISGVLLVGGDIHCSRLLKYPTEAQAGYPIHQCIVSPIHDRTIPKLNVPHPHLIRGDAVPHVWLRLEADSTQTPPTVHAEWVQMQNRPMWDLRLSLDDMQTKS